MSDAFSDLEKQKRDEVERWRKLAIDHLLSTFTKEQLVGELSKREGVKEFEVESYSAYHIVVCHDTVIRDIGAARILVVRE